MSKVFVSHKQVDSEQAAIIARRLEQNGLTVYLDAFDEGLRDGPELGDYLRRKMSDCSQLMAVVSRATKESWWVPWEIGLATEKDFLISTYAIGYTELPSYLKKWPYLKSLEDVDTYATKAKVAERRIATGALMQKSESAFDFHKSLKLALGQ